MIPFIKAHACGNDFLIIEEPLDSAASHAELARRLCARNTGIGADGIEYLRLTPQNGYAIRLFNADGSESEISGNGTRCVAAYLAQQENLEKIAIHTDAGLRRCRILGHEGSRYRIATEMGIPRVEPQQITLRDGAQAAGVHVSVGNPHFVLFVDNPEFRVFNRSWQQVGEEICTHPSFPHGTNVEFVLVKDTDSIEFRIFERGVGPTQSSGTGTSASAAASIVSRGLSRQLDVRAEGGMQQVHWPANDAELLLTGPAEIIARGECLL